MKKIYLITALTIFLFINFVSASNVGLIEDTTWQSNLTAVRFSATAFGDIDGDSDDDLAVIGCFSDGGNDCENGVIAKIYINNGTTLIENQTWQSNLTGVGVGSLGWGDIDNDGDLDLALSGCNSSIDYNCNGDIITKIYINNGTTLTESSQWQSNLTAIYDSSILIGDIDNDGDLDLIMNGITASSYIAKVYINNGSSLVENSQWQNNLTGINKGQIALGDVDNDGDLDIALTGETSSTADFINFYLNNETSFVESSQWNQNLVAMDRSSLIFADYNNDGNLDLIVCGQTTGDHCYLYKNNGSTLELNQTRDDGLLGIFRATIAFGDYDNDGDLDFVGGGRESGNTKILENNETNNYYFQDDPLAHNNLSDTIYAGSSFVWNDVDNDKDLDLVLIGSDFATTTVAKVFINNNTVSNTPPNASISDFSSSYSDGVLNLSWGNGSDIETPTAGLYYNLMIGNSTTNHTIVSGIFGGCSGGGGGAGGGANGYFGNMMQRKNISLNKYLFADTYYWYVQTIDTGLAKSNWSTGQSIVVGADTDAPNISSVSSSVISSTATITWTTDESANSTVYYGITTATASSSDSDDLVTSHSISLSGLSASTLYYYNVSSCDYWNNCNTSLQYSFTTSAAPSNGNGGNGGGSTTTTFWTAGTHAISEEEFENGYTKELVIKSRVRVKVENTYHYVGVINLTNTSVIINITSEPIQVVLDIGEEAKVDVLDDGFYDIYVLLNDINESKANLTIQSIHEEIPEGEGPVATTGEEVEGEEEIEGEEEKRLWLYGLIGVGVVMIIIIFFYLKKHLWKRELKNRRKKWQK